MKTTMHSIALALVLAVALGLSGCADSAKEPATPPPTTSAAAPAPVTSRAAPAPPPEPVAPVPGVAHQANYTYKADAGIPQATFKVDQAWETLEFRAQMFKSAQCGMLQAEPPAGTGTGPQPQITFTSPSGKKVGPVALGTYSSCDVNTHNKVGVTPPSMIGAGETGAWKIDINGRGVNVYVQVTVSGG